MKLIYKGEVLATLTDQEANEIANAKGTTIIFKGQRLMSRLVETREDTSEGTGEKRLTEYTKEELKAIIGNFEKEYHEATTGEIIHNKILGYVREGNVKHALQLGAITKRGEDYFVKLPEYENYQEKHNALRELIGRRDYAKKQNEPPREELKDKLSMV